MSAHTRITPSTGLATTSALDTSADAHTGVSADAVVAAYSARTPFARSETAAVRRPRLLSRLLNAAPVDAAAGTVDRVVSVAEIPCGAGHFLTDYASRDCAVTLVDASAEILAIAREHAHEAGLPPHRTHAVRTYVQDLDLAEPVDLMVVPNAALNQLAAQSPLSVLLARLRANMRSGGELLVQLACHHPGGVVDTATFYDPDRGHGAWFDDRWFDPERTDGANLRRRRQHRGGDRLRIEFDYHDVDGTSLHRTTVELTLFTADTMTAALTAAGFTHVRFLPGQGGLSEFLATADGLRR